MAKDVDVTVNLTRSKIYIFYAMVNHVDFRLEVLFSFLVELSELAGTFLLLWWQ